MRASAFTFALLASSLARATVPSAFSVQGVLHDSTGALQTMPVMVTVKLFAAQTGGSALATKGPTSVMATNGLFTFQFADVNLQTELAGAAQVWMEVTAGSDTFARQPVNPQLYALMCGTADAAKSVVGGYVDLTSAQTVAGAKTFTGVGQFSTQAAVASPASLVVGSTTATFGNPGSDTIFNGSIEFPGTGTRHGFFSYFPNKSDGNGYFRITGLRTAYGDGPVGLLVDGAVGIGTTAPTATLDVRGFVDTNQAYGFSAPVSGTPPYGVFIAAPASSTLGFYTAGAERFRVAPNGWVGIGTISPNTALEVDGPAAPLQLHNNVDAGAASNHWGVGPDANGRFVVYNESNTGVFLTSGSTSWSASSDIRLKKAIQPIERAIEKVETLHGVTYLFKTDADSAPRRAGLIAQDVQKVLPEAVSEKDGMLGVRYTEVIPLAVEAIKDQEREIRGLKSELTRMESDNAALRARLERIEAKLVKQAAR
jgi:hypothetical protein